MKTIMVTLVIQIVGEVIIAASSTIMLLAINTVRKQLKKYIRGKSLFFTGPEEAGKTTLINWITGKSFDKNYTPTPLKESTEYEDEDYDYSITDMGGGREFLERHGFDKLVRDHDITVFVFDVNKFLTNQKYREDVGDRLDFLWRMEGEIDGSKKILLIVGSHFDEAQKKCSQNVEKEFRNYIKDKEYAKLILTHVPIMANLTKEKEAKVIMSKLKGLIKKSKK